MKKIVCLVLSIMMLLGIGSIFTSCGNDANNTLVVAMSPDFAPMEFYDSSKSGDDAIVGFDVILANYIAKELGKTLIIKPMDFYACMAAVQSGSADIAISGFSWTLSRAETFLITDYYIAGENESEQTLIVQKKNENKYSSVNDFAGLKVAAQSGSLQELLVTEQLVPAGATLVKFDSTSDALTALKGGQVDAFAVADGNGDAFISQNEETIGFSGFFFELEEKYKNNVCLVNKNNQELCDQVNAALAKALAADVYDTWYAACKAYQNITTIDENGFDEDGNKIIEWTEGGEAIIDGSIVKLDATDEDAVKKAAYEQILANIKNGATK